MLLNHLKCYFCPYNSTKVLNLFRIPFIIAKKLHHLQYFLPIYLDVSCKLHTFASLFKTKTFASVAQLVRAHDC